MNKLMKESLIWAIMTVPFIYLSTVWEKLPSVVPTHFGLEGEANGWMSKPAFVWFLLGLILGLYLVLLIVPKIDPKKRIVQMGEKYFSLRVWLGVIFSLIACVNIYFAVQGGLDKPQILLGLMGFLLAVMGNYSQTIRPNYFLGFRTPWTLQSDEIWKATQLFCGRIWVLGGMITIGLSFIINDNLSLFISLISMIIILILVPYVYSYRLYKATN